MFPLGLYSMYDKLCKAYLPPWVSENDEVAVRQFGELLQDRVPYNRHPQDYWLFRIGEFHQDTGAIVAVGDVVRVSEGVGGPGVPADVDRADKSSMKQFEAWLQRQAAEGVNIRKLLEGGN